MISAERSIERLLRMLREGGNGMVGSVALVAGLLMQLVLHKIQKEDCTLD